MLGTPILALMCERDDGVLGERAAAALNERDDAEALALRGASKSSLSGVSCSATICPAPVPAFAGLDAALG